MGAECNLSRSLDIKSNYWCFLSQLAFASVPPWPDFTNRKPRHSSLRNFLFLTIRPKGIRLLTPTDNLFFFFISFLCTIDTEIGPVAIVNHGRQQFDHGC